MTADPAADPQRDGRFIPWLIVAFFVVITMVLSGFTYIAVTTYRGVVTEQAYEKGVNYNAIIARAEVQDELHLNSRTRLTGTTVEFSLTDKAGAPVTGAQVSLLMFRPTQEGMDRRYAMAEAGGGLYRADVADLPARGIWEARVSAQTSQGAYRSSQRVVSQ